MSARRRFAAKVLFLLSLSYPWGAFAPEGVARGKGPQLEHRPVSAAPSAQRRITLDVVVTDHTGQPVPGLQQQDFTLLDNKKPQSIVSFQAVEGRRSTRDLPLLAVAVVDAINTPFQGVSYLREGLDAFLRSGGGELPMPTSLVMLTDKSPSQSAPSEDGRQLAGELDGQQAGLRSITRSQGYWGGVERFQLSMQALENLISSESSQPGRKMLIWLGPGWPIFADRDNQMTNHDRAVAFSEVVTLSKELRDARITLYNVNPSGPDGSLLRQSYYEDFLKGVDSANRVQNGNLALQVLAVQSGGKVLNETTDVAESINRCLDDRKAFYILSFEPSAADHPDEYHNLQVKIDKHGLTARTRTGYYAQP